MNVLASTLAVLYPIISSGKKISSKLSSQHLLYWQKVAETIIHQQAMTYTFNNDVIGRTVLSSKMKG